MEQFKNILIAFDGSSGSMEALEAAKGFAKSNDAHLTVAYVQDQPPVGPVQVSPDSEPFTSAEFTLMNTNSDNIQDIPEEQPPDDILDKAKNILSKNLHVTYESLAGRPDEELNIYAIANDIDLIIIGNTGLNGIKKFFMGSVSKKISDNARCSVLIVK